jgi:hypothetical protein
MPHRTMTALSISVILAGCSFAGVISRESTEYNGTVEGATNTLTVTNVLRARDRLPLYFASLSALRGSLSQPEGFSLPVPFGPGKIVSGKKYVITLTGSVTNSPSFDIATLDTKEFTEGILAPIPLTVGQYYWDRNDYPKWLLANLFISKIEIERDCPPGHAALDPGVKVDPNDPLRDARDSCERPDFEVLENNPEFVEQQIRFERYLHLWLSASHPDPEYQAFFRSYTKEEEQGPVYPAGKVRLQDIVSLGGKPASSGSGQATTAPSGSNLKLKKTDSGYQLVSTSQAIAICPPRRSPGDETDRGAMGVAAKTSAAANELGAARTQIISNSASLGTKPFERQSACKCLDSDEAVARCEKLAKRPDGNAKVKEPKIIIYQRSVLQMFGYLGAIVRRSQNWEIMAGRFPNHRRGEGNPVGFHVYLGVPPPDVAVAVDYGDQTYFVRKSNPGYGNADACGNYRGDYTTKVMALLNELVNLSKNANELPATKTVVVQP